MDSIYARGAFVAAALAPFLAAAVAWSLWTSSYGAALMLLLCIVCLMELRVRMGYTLPRGPLFYMHVSSGALLLFALAALVWVVSAPWLIVAVWPLYLFMLLSGAALLVRNLRTHG
ncbi:MAG: hypothetical protein JWL87_209 [Candidatus Adlerbacteria bacterium]|nr:hypothetical protein [Candidatus Adlerbacteria bacterium]